MKNIIFDWGGVFLREYDQPKNIGKYYCDRDAIIDTIRYFNKNLTREASYNLYLNTLYDDNKVIISSLNDKKSFYNWFERINGLGNLNTDFNTFVRVFENNYMKIDTYKDVIEYIISLKDKVNLYLFSDLIFVCKKALDSDINLNIFKGVILSYNEHLTKRDIDAFKNVEEKYNINPENTLFIDNNPSNISNANKCKWNTCLASGYELDKIKRSVDEFLQK